MNRKTTLAAVLGLAAALFAGTAMAGHPGIPNPGKAYGHAKHYSYKHGRDYGHYTGRHHGHYRSYSHGRHYSHGYQYYRGPARVVRYSTYGVHRHGPSCGHSGYGHTWYRDYSPHRRDYGYHRDYGRAAFSGYDDGVGYYIEFDY